MAAIPTPATLTAEQSAALAAKIDANGVAASGTCYCRKFEAARSCPWCKYFVARAAVASLRQELIEADMAARLLGGGS